MAVFTMRQNDTAPSISATLTDAAGTAIDLTSATVKFQMIFRNGEVKIDTTATVDDAAAGEVSYAWVAADTDTAGWFRAYWEVTFADGTIRTFPTPAHTTVRIVGDPA